MPEPAELSVSEFSKILDLLPIGVYVVDAKGSPYFANKASLEILGKGLDPTAKPEDLAFIYQAYTAGTNELYPTSEVPVIAALAGKETHITNMEIRRPDKNLLIEVWGSPIKDETGNIIYAVAVFRDITDLVRANEKLTIRNNELEKMSSFMIEREKIINELRQENSQLKSRLNSS